MLLAVKLGVVDPCVKFVMKKEEVENNRFHSLAMLKGSKLKREFHKAYPKAFYTRPPFGWGEVARGMWKDEQTGISLIVRFDGGYELF